MKKTCTDTGHLGARAGEIVCSVRVGSGLQVGRPGRARLDGAGGGGRAGGVALDDRARPRVARLHGGFRLLCALQVPGDGACLFNSLKQGDIRARSIDWIEQHPDHPLLVNPSGTVTIAEYVQLETKETLKSNTAGSETGRHRREAARRARARAHRAQHRPTEHRHRRRQAARATDARHDRQEARCGHLRSRAGTTQLRAPSPAVRTFNRTVRRSKRGEAGLFCVPEQRRRTARAPDARDDHRTARCGSLRSPLACP